MSLICDSCKYSHLPTLVNKSVTIQKFTKVDYLLTWTLLKWDLPERSSSENLLKWAAAGCQCASGPGPGRGGCRPRRAAGGSPEMRHSHLLQVNPKLCSTGCCMPVVTVILSSNLSSVGEVTKCPPPAVRVRPRPVPKWKMATKNLLSWAFTKLEEPDFYLTSFQFPAKILLKWIIY